MERTNFELFIAGRYLRAKRKQAVISVITVISIIGVAAGVMALVIALAITSGLRTTLQRSLLGATAHVTILEKKPEFGIKAWPPLAPKLKQMPHAPSAPPGLSGAVGPSRLRCSVVRRPLVMASAITSAMTPAATPMIEITVMTEMTACLRLARR